MNRQTLKPLLWSTLLSAVYASRVTQTSSPQALLARAAHRRRRAASGETNLIEGIRDDLAEVEDIAGDEMRLYLTDLALERARLALDVPAAYDSPEAARAEAEAQTAKAAALIAGTGYHRRATANSPSFNAASPRPPDLLCIVKLLER